MALPSHAVNLLRGIAALVTAGIVAFSLGCGSTDSPTPTPASPTSATVYKQGTLTIPQTYIADLDAGEVVNDPYGLADVWFEAISPTERYLTSMGAMLAVYGTNAPGLAGCKAGALTNARIPMSALAPDLYLCARTDENRIVELRVVQLPGAYEPGFIPTLTLAFTTFNK
jgi:hypothetical protein